ILATCQLLVDISTNRHPLEDALAARRGRRHRQQTKTPQRMGPRQEVLAPHPVSQPSNLPQVPSYQRPRQGLASVQPPPDLTTP
ncbi:hypothetical protein Pmar_PMAR005106, partial [Perkinsus marinus ATCC 50983]